VTKNPGGAIKAKLDDRGEKCIFLGYAANNAPNVYRMWNLRTAKVMITRDIKWTGKMNREPKSVPVVDDDLEDDKVSATQRTTAPAVTQPPAAPAAQPASPI